MDKDRQRWRSVAFEDCQWERNKQTLFRSLLQHCYAVLHHLYVPPSSISIHLPPYHQHRLAVSFISSVLLCIHAVTVRKHSCAFQYSLCRVASAPCLSSFYGQTLTLREAKRRGGWVISPFTGKGEHHRPNVRGLHSLFPVRGHSVWLSRCGTLW